MGGLDIPRCSPTGGRLARQVGHVIECVHVLHHWLPDLVLLEVCGRDPVAVQQELGEARAEVAVQPPGQRPHEALQAGGQLVEVVPLVAQDPAARRSYVMTASVLPCLRALPHLRQSLTLAVSYLRYLLTSSSSALSSRTSHDRPTTSTAQASTAST
jgi:hypothetical protein